MSVSVCVCLCVCPLSYLPNHTSDHHEIFCACYLSRDSVLLWRRNDKLRTSGFMDDVISAHKPRLLDVAAQLRRSSHAALGVVIPVAGNGRTGLLLAVELGGSTGG